MSLLLNTLTQLHKFTRVQIRRVGLSKNILRVFEVADDIPLLTNYPRSHQVNNSWSILETFVHSNR